MPPNHPAKETEGSHRFKNTMDVSDLAARLLEDNPHLLHLPPPTKYKPYRKIQHEDVPKKSEINDPFPRQDPAAPSCSRVPTGGALAAPTPSPPAALPSPGAEAEGPPSEALHSPPAVRETKKKRKRERKSRCERRNDKAAAENEGGARLVKGTHGVPPGRKSKKRRGKSGYQRSSNKKQQDEPGTARLVRTTYNGEPNDRACLVRAISPCLRGRARRRS